MLVANVLQRMVGLLRNLGFCRFLGDAELGQLREVRAALLDLFVFR